ncbi:MAG: Ig-like domain-containing protein, partial [Bacteroidales bacterium]|nr:Ig-like domain-containing protein [Bacteroidales bacterium]
MKKIFYPLLLIALILNACTPMESPVFNGVSLSHETLTIPYGKTYTLSAYISPSRSTGKVNLVWSTSNPAVAGVDNNGLVTAYLHGEAIITVTASTEGASYTSSCVVTVIPVDIDMQVMPDEIFRNYCLDNFDKNKDGVLSSLEAMSVYTINVHNLGIASLEGIQIFNSLRRLDCAYNQLTTLDVSSNPALETLICNSNQLTTLDVSSNPALQTLYFGSNQLTILDVSSNTALESLSCYNNPLTTLDVSSNPALYYLSCYSNQLTTLDVSNNSALLQLRCYSNQLTTLDVSSN